MKHLDDNDSDLYRAGYAIGALLGCVFMAAVLAAGLLAAGFLVEMTARAVEAVL